MLVEITKSFMIAVMANCSLTNEIKGALACTKYLSVEETSDYIVDCHNHMAKTP